MGIHCYDDHRVAMSFSVLAAALAQNDDNSVLLQEKKCVEKTWPTWWDDLEKVLGVRCEGADFDAETETHGKPAAAAPQPSLVLIGMRGVGKTTLGCSLAAQLGYRFIDIDQELESTSGRSIALIIKESGWTEFRRLESETLIAVLSTCTLATVVSCGGGIIEGGPNIDALEQWTNEGRAVVHLRRPIDDIISFLDQDTSRPSFGQDIRSVWEKRRPLYERCSNYEFWAVPVNGRYNWPAIEQSFGRFTRSILGEYKRELATTMGDPKRRQISSDNDNKKASFFVSLTFPDMEPYVASLAMLCEGADAVEFRADLLADNADREYVARQLALVRQHISLPIIFTVRSRDQGGAFADNDEQSMFALLQLAVRWGCEIVDMEVSSSDGALDTLSATKRHAVIIASYHDTHSARPWTMPSMIEMCRRANAYGDIVKVIGKAADVECNFELSRLLTDKHSPIASVRKPVIAMNMGAVGQMSRVGLSQRHVVSFFLFLPITFPHTCSS